MRDFPASIFNQIASLPAKGIQFARPFRRGELRFDCARLQYFLMVLRDRPVRRAISLITVFGKQAEWVENKRAKGDLVLIAGNLEDRSYEKVGKIFCTTDRLANTFELLAKALE